MRLVNCERFCRKKKKLFRNLIRNFFPKEIISLGPSTKTRALKIKYKEGGENY